MNELQAAQAEKKAIQAELESIRAEKDRFRRSENASPSSISPWQQTATPSDARLPRPVPSRTAPPTQPQPGFQNGRSINPQAALSSNQQPNHRSAIHPAIQAAPQSDFPAPDFSISSFPDARSQEPSPQKESVRQPATGRSPYPSLRLPLERIEAQVQQINQLSQTQETALRRLQSIAAQIDAERRKAEQAQQPVMPSAIPSGIQPGMPSRTPSGIQPVTLQIRVPDRANETDYPTAQPPHQLQEHQIEEFPANFTPRRSRRRPPLLKRLRRWLVGSAHRDAGYPLSRKAATAESIPLSLRETLTLLLGAALTRLLLNLLLQAVPLLTIPLMLALIVPAGIVLYRATTTPQAGIVWGYRLCLLLLGLLIGGRL